MNLAQKILSKASTPSTSEAAMTEAEAKKLAKKIFSMLGLATSKVEATYVSGYWTAATKLANQSARFTSDTMLKISKMPVKEIEVERELAVIYFS